MGAGHERTMGLLAALPGHAYYGTIGAGLAITLLVILADFVLSPPDRRSRPSRGPAAAQPSRTDPALPGRPRPPRPGSGSLRNGKQPARSWPAGLMWLTRLKRWVTPP
jgi:hypothetical protein